MKLETFSFNEACNEKQRVKEKCNVTNELKRRNRIIKEQKEEEILEQVLR